MIRWINVEDRLPDTNGRYICAHKPFYGNLVIDICHFASPANNVGLKRIRDRGPVWYNTDCEYGDFVVSGVTHWMPLPEPPEVTHHE